jgi:large subunit ribosomal protein L10
MSKYVKELMMDQLRSDLDGSTSLLILDLKGLDAVAEHALRRDLRKKKIKVRALKNTLARRVFTDMGVGGLSQFLEGPSVAVWGGDGVAELAKEVSARVKALKKPAIKGGAVDGVVIGPDQVEVITKLPSREALIARVAALAMAPAQRVVALANAPASGLMSLLETLSEGAPEDTDADADAVADAPADTDTDKAADAAEGETPAHETPG